VTAILVAALAALGAPPTMSVRASSAQMLELAGRYVAANRPAAARAVLAALEQDASPDIRAEARYRQARLLAADGRLRDSALLYRRLLDERPGVAGPRIELAAILTQIGDEEGARRQLRAAQASGLPPTVARAVDRWSAALRSRQPFGGSLSIALAPDSNINRATRSDTLTTVIGDFTLSPDSAPHSGTGIALRGQAEGRLPLGSAARLIARLSASADLYKDKAFNDIAREVAIGPELRLGRSLVTLEGAIGQRHFGGEKLLAHRRVSMTLTRPVGRMMQLRGGVSRSWFDNRRNALQDGTATLASVAAERALSGTTGIGLSLSGERYAAADPAYSTRSWRAGLSGWQEVGRATLTAGIETGRLEADERLSLFPERRQDRTMRISAGVVLRHLTLFGFAPSVRITRENNRSSVELYQYRRTRTEFGIARAF
jgi:hypothetical protein